MSKWNFCMAAIAAVTLVGCGGSSDDGGGSNRSANLGVFIDSPVQGLSYQTATYSGVTDELGRYQYADGETVTFSLGDITFPAVAAAAAVHVGDLFTGGVDATETQNLARLLLTIDEDGDSDNGIQLSANAVNAGNTPEDLDFASESFDADIQDYLNILSVPTIVSVQDAQEHINDSLAEVEGLLAGCGNECVPRAAYNELVDSYFPRYEQQNVELDSNITITLTEEFTLDMLDTRIELHGVPVNTYDNCRIDWPGFRCDDLGIGSYDVADTINEYNVVESVNGLTLTVNPGVNLKPNYTYVVHVFNDGEAGDSDNYKTWWRFNTANQVVLN